MRFVIIGHLTRDITPDGHTLGGTASFAGITAHKLGADVTIVTRALASDVQHPALAGIQVVNLPSQYTTTFHNMYRNGERTQYLRAVAGPILAQEMPEHLFRADIALLAPLTQEVDPEIARQMRGIVGATPQGWLREWDSQGRIRAIPWHTAGRVLPHLDAIVVSEADLIAAPESKHDLIAQTPVVVVTQAAAGCDLYVNGVCYQMPPRPAQEMDPTGAGDVFAAAFLIHLMESRNPLLAAHFANVTASFSVEAPGTTNIPNRSQVEAYLAAHPLPDIQPASVRAGLVAA